MKIIYKLRGFLAALPILFALFFVFGSDNLTLAIWGWSLGVPIFSLGVFIRIWGIQHLWYRIKKNKILTTTGPYQFVRNPLYIGNTLICVGAVLLSHHLWLGPITLVYCFILYTGVIACEESHLKEKYGQPYMEFIESTPRWFPRFSKPTQALQMKTEEFGSTLKVELPAFLLVVLFGIREFVVRWLQAKAYI